MKKIYFSGLLMGLCVFETLLAQNVAINYSGSPPAASAMLDIDVGGGTSRGLLMPRVTTGTLPASPIAGLIAYCTDVSAFYYYDGTAWRIILGNNTGWLLSGNSLGGTEFIGSTNAQPFIIRTNNTERIRVLSTGLTGIGTSTPGYLLTLAGGGGIFAVDNTATFLAKNSAGTYENYFWPRWSDNIMYMNYGSGGFNIRNNGSTSTMFMTNANNVGIGNTAPGAKLDVTGPATGSGITIRAAGGGDVVLNSGGSLFFDGNYSYAAGNYIRPVAANTQAYFTSGSERMRITSAGNVGIGTTSPGTLLEVANNNTIKLGQAFFSSGGNYMHLANNTWYNGAAWISPGATPGALLQFSADNTNFYTHNGAGAFTPRMSIANTGIVRINNLVSGASGAVVTSNSSGDLSINNFSGSASNILLGNNTWGTIVSAGGVTGSGTVDYLARWTTATNLGTGVTRDNNSTVGINVAPSASNRLYVDGASAMNAILGQYNATQYGYLGLSTAGAYGQYSATLYGYLGTANSGVFGTSNNAAGAGVWGNGSTLTTGVYGDVNLATDFGMWGQNTNASGTGIVGAGNNIAVSYLGGGSGGAFSSTNVGVYGYGNNTANSYGVYGVSGNTTGEGVYGYNSTSGNVVNGGDGVYGQTGQAQGVGVWGFNVNNQTPGTTGGTGVFGNGCNQTGSYLTQGSGGAFTGYRYGLVAKNVDFSFTQQASILTWDGGNNQMLLNAWSAGGTHYKVWAGGLWNVSGSVPDLNGNMVTMHCPETPEFYLQDYGQGQLVNGKAHIDIDPILAKNVAISEKHPLRVFVQLEGNCKGVYVTNKTATGFDVVELDGGTSNIPFQWSITCNAKDQVESGRINHLQDLRFEAGPQKVEQSTTKPVPTKSDMIEGEKKGVERK